MKTQNLFSGKSRLFMLCLIGGLLFSFNGFSQDGGTSCACVKKIQNGNVITFLNVSSHSQTSPHYVMLTDCVDGENCPGTCTWAYNEGIHGWKIENGQCMEWPDVKPVDGQKSNPHIRTEMAPDKAEVFGVYPNPATGAINIKSSVDNVTSIIYDITGAEMMRSKEKTIDVSQLSSGSYIISMTDGIYLQREQLVIK